MKKFAPLLLLFLFAMVAWEAVDGPSGMSIVLDGDHIDGPFGALVAMLFAGGGLLIAVIALLLAGIVLAVVFAGLGVLAVSGLVVGAIVLAALVSPLLLPLLIPIAIIWYLTSRDRKNRERQAVKPS